MNYFNRDDIYISNSSSSWYLFFSLSSPTTARTCPSPELRIVCLTSGAEQHRTCFSFSLVLISLECFTRNILVPNSVSLRYKWQATLFPNYTIHTFWQAFWFNLALSYAWSRWQVQLFLPWSEYLMGLITCIKWTKTTSTLHIDWSTIFMCSEIEQIIFFFVTKQSIWGDGQGDDPF